MIKITPVDLLQHEFSRRLRGLDPEEVQNFLKDIAEEIEELVRENTVQAEKLRQQAEEIGQFQEKEAALRNTLITAQKISEQIKESAEREAHLITREAEIRAKKILEEVQGRLSQVEADITELKRQRSNLRAKIRSALQAHQELLAYTLEEEAGQESKKGEKK
jgi:cell division initiation protein